jgi:regulator of PEP synthase PpsR (kinase-PPPase family)
MTDEKALQSPIVYVISDSIGETAEFVVRAAASQFNGGDVQVRRVPYVDSQEAIDEIVQAAQEDGAMIAFTIVIPELQQYLKEQADERNVRYVDIMGPMLTALESAYNRPPRREPGLVRKLDEDYFRRVEAIEFAVKYDDGRDPRGLLHADVVLIGVSRTSKTPLSMYLAHKRLKVANVPLVPEVEPPEELFRISHKKIIGLTIEASHLNRIRRERLKALGLTSDANYASVERIQHELEYSDRVMKRLGCTVINVSTKAVEETANMILDLIRQGRTR